MLGVTMVQGWPFTEFAIKLDPRNKSYDIHTT